MAVVQPLWMSNWQLRSQAWSEPSRVTVTLGMYLRRI